MKLGDIRSTFLDFFKNNQHEIISSSPLVPQNDPTLLFTNAGMVQFKDVFTGAEKRPYTRATTSQKCLRAGGKHNDLENVGYTARHHTFFEMLGNFSFGDYFKESAILFAWDLLTKHFHIPTDKMLMTVYHTDDEAFNLWKKISGFDDSRIIRIPTKDNFWSMGDTGPCGPCTEIFYDHGEGIPGGPPGSANEDGDRFIEIWNLVFMQFEQLKDGNMINLPKPSVDTGMGLERIAAVLQGVHSNYETDLFQKLIHASKDLTKNQAMQQSHQVIADHLRACSFLMADGVLPSNEGRGYVLRRIMRRAMRHAHLLGAKEPLMHKLVPTLISEMGSAYPELPRAEALMINTFKAEEEKFRETLDRGLKLLKEETEKLSSSQMLSGDVAFKLYDTYGFPLDLTADVLRGEGKSVDMNGFEAAMNNQKAMARAAWSGSGDTKKDQIWFDLKEICGKTKFLGYDLIKTESTLKAIVVDGKSVTSLSKKNMKSDTVVDLVFDETPFYGESGGQVGDAGTIYNDKHGVASVINAFKPFDDLIVHRVNEIYETLEVGKTYLLVLDHMRREKIKKHHSVTHLLHRTIRDILGKHVVQKGSLVSDERLRFDFTHPGPLSADEIMKVEFFVNLAIQFNIPVTTRISTPSEAVEAGAMALFGEKYGESVRVVAIGDQHSVELCGGTHVRSSGEIGFFKIISESGIAAGIRRIEAVAGMAAFEYIRQMLGYQKDITDLLKTTPSHMMEKVQKLLDEQKVLNQQISELKKKVVSGEKAKASVETVGLIKIMAQHFVDYDVKEIKGLIDTFKKDIGSGVIFLTNVNEGKVTLFIGVTQDLSTSLKANEMIKSLSPFVGGQGGGGRPDLAQAGGNDPSSIEKAYDALKQIVQSL